MSQDLNFTIRHTSQVIYASLHGGVKAYLKYSIEGNTMKLIETYTPPEYRGLGIASRLVKYAIDLAREKGWTIEPVCSYTIYYFMKNPHERAILSERYKLLSEEDWKRLYEEARGRELKGKTS